jgi:hypothetical protein
MKSFKLELGHKFQSWTVSYFGDIIATIFLGGIGGNVLLPLLVYHTYN